MKVKTILSSILLIALAVGCSKKLDPQDLLKTFIDVRFSKSQSKSELLQYVSGKMKEDIENMSEEDFQTFTSMPIRKRSFKVVDEKCSELKCSIIYTLKYDTYEGSTKLYSTDVKKIAEIEKFEEGWRIVSVANIKGHHDIKEPIQIKLN